MEITAFYEPDSGTFTYLLADEVSGQAAIIDPVWVYDIISGQVSRKAIEPVLQKAKDQGLNIQWVLETHAHADHLTAAAVIKQETGARVGIGRGICGVQENFKKIYNFENLATDGSQFDRLLHDGEVISLGNLEITVMETPGHTDDSVTYLVGDAAFIGDTLFAPNFGSARCDFPGGDAGKLFDTINKIYGLPAETRLFLCHDYPPEGSEPRHMVTVAESIAENIHIDSETSRDAYIEMRETRDAQLDLPKLIYPSVQVNILAGHPPVAESNSHSYLKIPFATSITDLLKDS